MQTVLITGKKTDFDKHLAKIFEREGYDVFIADRREPSGSIDIYIDVSDKRDKADTFSICDGLDEKVIRRLYKANVLKPMALLEKYLPLLDKGSMKRLCFISSADASINETRSPCGYAYKMSKAAMHNLFMITWNTLEVDGYTFRVYDPMQAIAWQIDDRETAGNAKTAVDAKSAAEGAFTYFTKRRGTENADPMRDDENRLVMRDALGREHTW